MKRILILVTSLLLLAGCGNLPGSTAAERKLLGTISPYYRTGVRFSRDGLDIAATIDNTAPDACAISVTSPEHLKGYTYRVGENGIEVDYRALSFTLDPTGAATAAPLLQAMDALADLLRPAPDELPAREEGFWTLSGEIDSGATVLWIEEESGLPAKLSLLNGELQITLENFVFFG